MLYEELFPVETGCISVFLCPIWSDRRNLRLLGVLMYPMPSYSVAPLNARRFFQFFLVLCLTPVNSQDLILL